MAIKIWIAQTAIHTEWPADRPAPEPDLADPDAATAQDPAHRRSFANRRFGTSLGPGARSRSSGQVHPLRDRRTPPTRSRPPPDPRPEDRPDGDGPAAPFAGTALLSRTHGPRNRCVAPIQPEARGTPSSGLRSGILSAAGSACSCCRRRSRRLCRAVPPQGRTGPRRQAGSLSSPAASPRPECLTGLSRRGSRHHR